MANRHILLLLWCLLVIAGCRDSQAADEKLVQLELTDQNYSAWRDFILPAKNDLGWQEIPWLTTFQDGILDANRRNLPLLFWTMNGHPLGCT